MLRTSIARVARPFAARSFASSTVAVKDLVQELYVKELKAYKPAAPASDASASIKGFSAPAAPKTPELLGADALAKELAAYDADVATPEAPTVSAHADESDALGADEYLHLVEADVHVEAHH
ncbi:F-type H+-transporting ATPase subunit h [Pseudohyphozyma bogoriensis]|nr:F-type H+-transporting ATPase subunit h [Pseudohyphozyma bogoriensis]